MHKRPQAGYGNFTHFINTAGGVALPVPDMSGMAVQKNKQKSEKPARWALQHDGSLMMDLLIIILFSCRRTKLPSIHVSNNQ